MSEMGKLVEEVTQAGVLLDTAGLRPTSEGVRLRLRRGKISGVDGPFTETRDAIGGYALIEVESREEAIQSTTRFLRVHGREWDIDCEVRQLDGSDSGARCGT